MSRAFRLARGWLCCQIVTWLPLGWTDALLPHAGDWIYRREAAAARLMATTPEA